MVPSVHGQIDAIKSLKEKAAGADAIYPLQVTHNGQAQDAIKGILYPEAQQVCLCLRVRLV